jgi:hypothetical protein
MNAATPETGITKTGLAGSLSALARRVGPWLVLALAALGAGLYIRYGLIESTPTGLMCQSAARAWYCLPRDAVIQFNLYNGWSWAAMIGGLLAILFGSRSAVVLGIVAGAAGLALYNAGPAGFGLLLALMRLLRR